MPTEAEIIEAIRPVQDPELHRSIVDLGMLKEVAEADGAVRVLVALTTPGCPLKNEITNRVKDAVAALPGVRAVQVDFTAMTPEELAALRQQLNGNPAATAGSQAAHGHAEGRAIPFADPRHHEDRPGHPHVPQAAQLTQRPPPVPAVHVALPGQPPGARHRHGRHPRDHVRTLGPATSRRPGSQPAAKVSRRAERQWGPVG